MIAVTEFRRDLRDRYPSWLGLALAVLVLLANAPAASDDTSGAQIKSLDEQVQEIKSDVLGIAAELSSLEEKLLYPSDTHIAVFLSLAEGEEAELDWVRVQIDGELVTHHIYSFRELDALKNGGVQRIYTGNLPTGSHQVDVSAAGKLSGGRDWSGSQTFDIEKAVGPKVVEIELAANEFGQASIRVEEP